MAIVSVLEDDEKGVYLEVKSPMSFDFLGEIECTPNKQVNVMVERAKSSQSAWKALSFKQRAEYVYKLRKILLNRQDEILEQLMQETGKSLQDAMFMEFFAGCDAITYYAKRAKKFLKSRKKSMHGIFGLSKTLKIAYEPLGVIGIITPWNAPFVLSINPTVQALMAGNSVVLKGSEITPFTSRLLESVFKEAGFPDGVFQVIYGAGATGEALVDSGVDKICFTGSVTTGKMVAQRCAKRLIPVTLELGGKDPMIVCEDADLDRAASGALHGSCMNTGHYCAGTERIYVVEKIYDQFMEKVLEKGKRLRQGKKWGGNEDVGAISWDKQLAIIEAHVKDAAEKGASVLLGGKINSELKGLYYEPTVIADVNHQMDIMTKETFGPILSIMKVKNEDQAITLANDSKYGLSATVWSKNKKKAEHIARQLHTGMVNINDVPLIYGVPAAPFGGVKDSGIGQVNSEVGIRSYCYPKPILIDRFGGPLVTGYPYSNRNVSLLKKSAMLLWRTPLGKLFN